MSSTLTPAADYSKWLSGKLSGDTSNPLDFQMAMLELMQYQQQPLQNFTAPAFVVTANNNGASSIIAPGDPAIEWDVKAIFVGLGILVDNADELHITLTGTVPGLSAAIEIQRSLMATWNFATSLAPNAIWPVSTAQSGSSNPAFIWSLDPSLLQPMILRLHSDKSVEAGIQVSLKATATAGTRTTTPTIVFRQRPRLVP